MDPKVQAAINNWLNHPAISDLDKAEINALVEDGNAKELTDRFYRELEFGTAGLRGLIGQGINRINVYTVGSATQGLANYISKQGEAAKKAGVAIAYDCRRKSDVFAKRTAEVLAANGITAYLFEKLRPTPELSFAVRHLKCTAGIVITASHNPPAYNGYKVYWSDGVQIVAPHDDAIIKEVRQVGGFENVKCLKYEDGVSRGLIKLILGEVDEAFLAAVQSSCLDPQLVLEQGGKLKIVYTSLHGTGGQLIPEALRRRGFQQVIEVPEQAQPDGEFRTVKSPNPEEKEALTLAVKLAEKLSADIVMGTDPDADRMGVAIRTPDGQYELLTGNQTGSLMTWYVCEHLTRAGKFPKNGVVISTIVSGDLMKEIGRGYGAEVIDVLTGFKWIGAKVAQFEKEGSPEHPSKTYLFGSEESYGYMPATYVRDKDAVTSAVFFADLTALAASRGQSVYAMLQELYKRFGYFQESALNLELPGKEGAAQIQSMMAALRTNPPEAVAGIGVARVGDIQTGEIRDTKSKQVVDKYDLPKSNVILFYLADGSKVIARPSGTEPKIKFYVLVREPADDLAQAKSRASAKIEAIKKDITNRVNN